MKGISWENSILWPHFETFYKDYNRKGKYFYFLAFYYIFDAVEVTICSKATFRKI